MMSSGADPSALDFVLKYIGAIGGILGTSIAIWSLIRVHYVKKLELRVEVRKADGEARRIAERLPGLLAFARGSHENVSVADGDRGSGNLVDWLQSWDADHQAAQALIARLPMPDTDYRDMQARELEELLIAADDRCARLTRIEAKYGNSLVADKAQSERIRAEKFAVALPQIQQARK